MSANASEVLLAAAITATGDLPAWLRGQRWFGAKGRAIASVTARDAIAPGAGGGLVLVEVSYADRSPAEHYVAALTTTPMATPAVGALGDASDDTAMLAALLDVIADGGTLTSARGATVSGRPGERAEHRAVLARARTEPLRRLRAEQSNTSYVLGTWAVLKLLRRVQPGTHPDDEVVRYLAARAFPHVPPALGTLWYRRADDAESTALALVQSFVNNHGDAWSATVRGLESVLVGGPTDASLASIERLGTVTGELHAALAAAGPDAPDFVPRPLDDLERGVIADRSARRIARIRDIVARSRGLWPNDLVTSMTALLPRAEAAVTAMRAPGGPVPNGLSVIRVHGDYHLGQVLVTDAGFAIIDFEGEPALPIAARRARASALRDVAGMLRSLDYASHVAAREVMATGGEGAPARAAAWEGDARTAFLRGYLPVARAAAVSLVPGDDAALMRVLAAYELEKSLYEVLYEIDHRPDWVSIPALGVERALAALGV